MYYSRIVKLNPEYLILFCFLTMRSTWKLLQKRLSAQKPRRPTQLNSALANNIKECITYKQHLFATLNHKFNAVTHLAWQRGSVVEE